MSHSDGHDGAPTAGAASCSHLTLLLSPALPRLPHGVKGDGNPLPWLAGPEQSLWWVQLGGDPGELWGLIGTS